MAKLLEAGIILVLVLGGCGDAGAADGGGFGGSGDAGLGGSGDAGTAASGGLSGSGGTDSEPDIAVECDLESCLTREDGTESCLRWAEFPADPGHTEYTICSSGSDAHVENYPGHPLAQDTCWRGKAPYYEGTRTGFVTCGPNTTSITVHR